MPPCRNLTMRGYMDQPTEDKGAGESQSPEAVAFETALRQILKVSKKEVERREKEGRKVREPHPRE